MLNRNIRRLALLTAVSAYLGVIIGGANRTLGMDASAPFLATDIASRMAALAASLFALATIYAGGKRLWERRLPLMAGTGLIPVLAAPVVLGQFGVWAPYLSVVISLLATWLIATAFSADENTHHSKLSMFQSQWQVPLYAGLGTLAATVMGGYLKQVGAEATCVGWPICDGTFGNLQGLMLVHLVHRAAVAVAGFGLLYTVIFVWRRHLNRPGLLTLTGITMVLYTTEVILGRQATLEGLTFLSAVAHLAIAGALVCTFVAISVVGYYAPSLPVIAGGSAAAAVLPTAGRPFGEVARDYYLTMKPRLVLLLLITGYAAMWVAAKGFPDFWLSVATMLGLGLSGGAANSINQWFDRDIDAIMKRTRNRPIPAGRLTPGQVLGFAIMTGALSFILLAFAVNLLTALLSLVGLLFYVCIYTMWLKRSTDLNTVIGGVCGAVPPMVGWAAVTGSLSWAPVAMFLIMFMWQPPHFWALALFRNEDYRAASIPMLPVTKGERHTKWQILIYSVLLFPTVWSLYWTGVVGKLYLWASVAATVIYLGANIRLFFERLPEQKWAKKSFYWSLYWLTVVYIFMVIDIKR